MKNRLCNENGVALIMALSILVVMSVLGAVMMKSTTSEITVSGQYKGKQQAFYTADRAVEFAMEAVASGEGTFDLVNGTGSDGDAYLEALTLSGSGTLEDNPPNGEDGHDPHKNRVTFIGVGPPPPGSGNEANTLQGRYYEISVTGVYPQGSPRFRSSLRAEVGKIVPK